MRIILASQSPRRKELLEQIGVKFEIIPAKGEEIVRHKEPQLVVEDLSYQKAVEIFQKEYKDFKIDSSVSYNRDRRENDFLIIGSDTVVAYKDKILGKPKDEAEAVSMLTMLQGRSHHVFTGVTLIYSKDEAIIADTFHIKTNVFMYPMTEKEILKYVASKEPMDKAGSYAIQGKCAPFIEKIEGDYNTVVGLPVAEIYQHLLKVDIDILNIS